MNKNEQWLKWAVELQAIAQGGLFYGKDKFDIERYERKIIPSYNETLNACFIVVKSKFFTFFLTSFLASFFNATRNIRFLHFS